MSMYVVCVSVCVSVREDIFGTTHAIFIPNLLRMMPMDEAWSSSGRMTKYQGKEQFWGFSSLLTMPCTA